MGGTTSTTATAIAKVISSTATAKSIEIMIRMREPGVPWAAPKDGAWTL